MANPTRLYLGIFSALLLAVLFAWSHHKAKGSSALAWQPCTSPAYAGWFSAAEQAQALECAVLRVPLTYPGGLAHTRKASEPSMALAMARLPAIGHRRGSLVVIPGGPGQPGLGASLYLSGELAEQLQAGFDVVTYDPRGVGQSMPGIVCSVPGEQAGDVAGVDGDADDPEWQVRDYVAGCVRYTGLQVLKHVGSHEATNDLELIRQALGDPGLTAIAYSYGTQLAALYAERYPAKVRALVLDGVVDLSEDEVTQRLSQARAYQATFERFVSQCQHWENCPLPADPQAAYQRLEALLTQVDARKLRTSEGEEVTRDDVLNAFTVALLWRWQWPDLAKALLELAQDKPDAIRALADTDLGSADALVAIICADIARPTPDVAEQQRRRQYITEAVVGMPKSGSDGIDYCDIWPFSGSLQAHVPVRSPLLPDLLFVAQRHDPTTPYANARRMADYFRSPLLSIDGDGHALALLMGEPCVDNQVLDYLLAPERKRRDSQCPAMVMDGLLPEAENAPATAPVDERRSLRVAPGFPD